MPTIEEGIFGLLNSRAEMKASSLFPDASGANCRLYPGTIAEEATLPAAAFARAGGARSLTMTGPESPIRARFQFTVASSDEKAANGSGYDDCAILLDVIISILHGYAGQLPNGMVVQQARVVMDPIDDYSVDAKLYFRHADIEFVYEPAA